MKKITLMFLISLIPFYFTIAQVLPQGRLTPELLWKMGRISEFSISPDGKNLVYGITWYDLAKNKGNRDLYTLPVSGGNPTKLTDFLGNETNELWRPDGKKIGFISAVNGSSQLWEMNPDGSDKKQITNIEGGINGFSYAPDMKHLLYIKDVKMAKKPQEIYPDLPLTNVRIIDDLMFRHWDSWFDYTYSHVFIASYNDGAISNDLDLLNNEPYDVPLKPWGGMEEINWSPDGKNIAYTCVKLKGKEYALSTNSDIYVYNIDSKTTENFSQGMLGYDKDPVFSPDGTKIVWKSMKTPGYESDKDRIILYDIKSKSTTDLSANFDQSSEHFVWSPKSDKIYFISGIKATFQVYGVDLTHKSIIHQITSGMHDYTELALSQNALIGAKMSISSPTEIFRIDEKTGKEEQLTFTNKDILSQFKMGRVEERWIKTTDNKQMLTWIIYPPYFDPSKKYPALLYCQGGPQSAVSQFFSYRWNLQIMAANDYIIIAPNRRGLPTFGQEWNDEIAGDYGGQNMKDYLSATDSMAKESFINKDKLGAVGASYGGYSIYWLAGNHNKRFKVFIAHCGMFNLESQYGTTEEIWFANHDMGGPYWQNPQPKSYSYSPHKYVGNWDTPILIVTGEHDFRVPYSESLQAFNAAQLRGIPSKLLLFPEGTHFVLKPQNSVLWQREFFSWLDKYLK